MINEKLVVKKANGENEIDPYGYEFMFNKWADEVNSGEGVNYAYFSDRISVKASEVLVRFLLDLKIGRNLAKGTKRGGRSAITLINTKSRIPFIVNKLETRFKKEFVDLEEDDVLDFFEDMKNGMILTNNDEPYKDSVSYMKSFIRFWRYYMRIAKKYENKNVYDICQSLDTSKTNKPPWDYITYEQAQQMSNIAPSPYYKALILFLFDSGIRAPKELMNVRVKDITPIPDSEKMFLQIRDETSKTFGRKIKLMLSSEAIKIYLDLSQKKEEEMLFDYSYQSMNKMIKKLGYQVMNIGYTKKDKNGVTRYYEGISMYDFRHSSVCYYLPIYQSENQMKYRYGWKKSNMIHYYSEFIGMKDTINEDKITNNDIQQTKNQEKEQLLEQMRIQKEETDQKIKQLEQMLMKALAKN